MADNYIVKDTKKLIASDDQFSFRNEMNKEVQRVRNSIMSDGEVSILGTGNYIANSVKKTIISGSNNFVSSDANITGNDNKIDSNALIIGDRNIVSSQASKSIIIGNDITATQSNTSYLQNLVIPNGGTLNGNSYIGVKSYIWRLDFSLGVATYTLIYTNDLSKNIFSYSYVINVGGWYQDRYEFKINCNNAIFNERTVVKATLRNARTMYESDTVAIDPVPLPPIDIPFQAQTIGDSEVMIGCYSAFVMPVYESLGATQSVLKVLGLYDMSIDIQIDVYDPSPVVPILLYFDTVVGDPSTIPGFTYSLDSSSFIISEPTTLLELDIYTGYAPNNIINTVELQIDNIVNQSNTYISSSDIDITYNNDAGTGTYKWYINTNELYSATYSLKINDVMFNGSLNIISGPTGPTGPTGGTGSGIDYIPGEGGMFDITTGRVLFGGGDTTYAYTNDVANLDFYSPYMSSLGTADLTILTNTEIENIWVQMNYIGMPFTVVIKRDNINYLTYNSDGTEPDINNVWIQIPAPINFYKGVWSFFVTEYASLTTDSSIVLGLSKDGSDPYWSNYNAFDFYNYVSLQVDFLTKSTDAGNILNLTTDTATSLGFTTTTNEIKIFTTALNYSIEVYINGGPFQVFTGLSGDTVNIITNGTGDFTYFVLGEVGMTFTAELDFGFTAGPPPQLVSVIGYNLDGQTLV